MPSDDQINSYLERLNEARQAYEQDHPDWRLESLYWILERGLGGLRKLLKSNTMSWRDPFVELRFPVDCQWTSTSDSAPFVVACNIKRSDFKDEETTVKSLTKLMVSQIEIDTLQSLTHDAVYVREGEAYRTMFSAEDVERLQTIASPEERDRQMRELLRPFSFGGGTIDAPPEAGEGAPISETTAAQLAAINPPLLMVPTPDGTEAGEAAVIFEIGPMIAIPAEKVAYFPLIVGLTLFPDETEGVSGEGPAPGWLKFAGWSEEQRDKLWESLFAAITQHLGQLGTVTTAEFKAAVLTVNSQIEVTQRSNESLDELRQRALAGLQQAGTVISYDTQLQAESTSPSRAEIRAALERVEAAHTSQENTMPFLKSETIWNYSIRGILPRTHCLCATRPRIRLLNYCWLWSDSTRERMLRLTIRTTRKEQILTSYSTIRGSDGDWPVKF